jgi:hypothetical protein
MMKQRQQQCCCCLVLDQRQKDELLLFLMELEKSSKIEVGIHYFVVDASLEDTQNLQLEVEEVEEGRA